MIKFEFWKKKKRQVDEPEGEWGQPYNRYADTTRSSMFAAGDDDWDVTTSRPVFAPRPEGTRTYEDFLRARGQSSSRTWDGPVSRDPYGVQGGYGRRYYDDVEEETEGLTTRRAIQVLGAVALTAVLYFTFHSDNATAQKVTAYVKSAMTEDTKIEALSNWWQQNVSDKVAVPTMAGVSTGTADASNTEFVLPVTGTVKTPYDGKEQQGITFTTTPGSDVLASAKGAVEKIEKQGKEDYSVTINHGTTIGKTVYSHLVSVAVAENDWVDPSQSIGLLAKKGDHAELFFAYEKQGVFVDPAEFLKLPSGR